MQKSFDPANLKSRFLRSLGASAFGQFVTISIQVLSVPLFLYFWGAEKYGEWLILSAIPAYLSLSDVGFASVAGNEMTMLSSKNDRAGVLAVYQSGWALISGISVIVLMLVAGSLALYNPGSLLNIKHIPSQDIVWILLLLATQVLVSLQGGMLSAGFRALGNNALGIMYGNSIRLFEWISAAIALALKYGPLEIAITFLSCRLIGTALSWFALSKVAPWLRMGVTQANKLIVVSLLKPAIAFMAFPLGLAISLQGAVIVIGTVLGPVSVAVFSTYRTLSRLLVQAIAVINQACWPEISAAYGAKNIYLVKKIHRRGFVLAFWFGLIGILIIGTLGDWFVGIWTHHKLPDAPLLLWLLLLGTYLNILWQPSSLLFLATNRHQYLSIIFLTSSIAGFGLIVMFTEKYGTTIVALIFVMTELPLMLVSISSALKLLNESLYTFITSPIRFLLSSFRTNS